MTSPTTHHSMMTPGRSLACAIGLLLLPLSFAAAAPQSGVFPLSADARPQPDVPVGTVTDHELLESKTFPGTVRRYSVYVPAQYSADKPAALMVFQDGHAYLSSGGPLRAPVVFDNLIHRGEMPVTIGVFVDPGHVKDQLPEARGWQPSPENRSLEYDSLGPAYAQFLVEDLLPMIEETYSISRDPELRAIGGLSSGGICAFTAAWERPDQFSKVLSHVGSFTNIRHGDTYPGIIRKTEKKPIRVYLQDGSGDLDNQHGNWWLGNLQMDSALRFKEYDVRFDRGLGGHGGEHGGAMLPDALRWLWRDAPGVTPKLAIMPEVQDASWAQSWWMPRHEAKLAARKSMGRVDLLMIGDSITHEWENPGREVWDEYYGDRHALNIGFSGDRTEHVIWRLQNGAVDDIQPKLAVLMIGTNNTGHRQEKAEHTAAGVQRVIAELRLRLPETKVLLLGVFPRGGTSEDPLRKLNDSINGIISGFADEKSVWYLDLSKTFLEADGVLSREIMPDLLHPQLKGYRRWAEAMEPTLVRLLQ
ncbi:MAG: enterochelin esterase-like enzyme/lysophospholipase L1-like esterase [Planctomycetota bacterium]